MNETALHPYTMEIIPPQAEGGSYQCAIRKNGKLVQRSDRSLRSEDKAREHALAEIEKLQPGFGER